MTPQEVRDRHHGHPYEVVIPCMTLEEANAEKADLHAAVEARAFVRPAGAGGVLDRDQARAALLWAYGGRNVDEIEEVLDRLAGCVRPAEEPDYAAVNRSLLRRLKDTESGGAVQHPGELVDFDTEFTKRDALAVRPVAGVTLTPEDVPVVLEALRYWVMVRDSQGVTGPAIDRQRALAARLEAAS